MMSSLAGTGTLIRLILRRDRLRLPLWILGIVGMLLATAASFPGLYATAADRQSRAELMRNPTARALGGPGFGLDDYTYGAMLANEMLSFMALAVAFMSILLVVRHTRSEEESGRTEMIRASVAGRYSSITATLVVVGGANVVIALLLALGLPAIGADLPFVGSIAFAVSLASVGLVFAGIALVAAQNSDHGRGAIGLAAAALGVAYTLRAVGDIGNSTFSWLSPIGWAQATRSYVDERWWPLLLSVALLAVLIVVALALSTRRDVGAGLLATRPGPAVASMTLANPMGLAFRLQRGAVIGWSVGLFIFGLGYGTFLSEAEEFAGENGTIQEAIVRLGGASFTESFAATIALFLALLAAAFAVQSALRPRGEESAGRVEPLLSTALPRWRWLGGYLGVALIGGAGILLLGGLGMGITAAATTNDSVWLSRMFEASLVHVPALWLTVGIAIALFGFAPRLVSLAWLVLVYGLIVGMLGGLLNFPDWVSELTPFAHTPAVPAVEVSFAPLALLTILAMALIAVGLVGFQRRDIET